jgi:hypothetical protein
MPKQRTVSVADDEGSIDAALLELLIHSENSRPWSIDEITREIGFETTDSLNRLYGYGVIHRLDGFVWATRAAIAANYLRI